VSAWTVNQLARERELDVQRLVKAGEALEQAHREAISGGDASGFARAREEEDAAIRRLVDAAGEFASASGTTLDRVAKTLRAAAATEEGRRLVKQGRLAEDLEPPGFEALLGLAAGGSATRDRRAPSAGREDRRQVRRQIEALRRRTREAEESSEQAADEARDLERHAREAEQAAKQARRSATKARERADAAAEKARRLKDELTELEKR
jgi:hypothetical protein